MPTSDDVMQLAEACAARVSLPRRARRYPSFAEIEEHLVKHYGSSPSSWGDDIVYCRLQPSWMVGYAFDKAAVLEQAETPVTP